MDTFLCGMACRQWGQGQGFRWFWYLSGRISCEFQIRLFACGHYNSVFFEWGYLFISLIISLPPFLLVWWYCKFVINTVSFLWKKDLIHGSCYLLWTKISCIKKPNPQTNPFILLYQVLTSICCPALIR